MDYVKMSASTIEKDVPRARRRYRESVSDHDHRLNVAPYRWERAKRLRQESGSYEELDRALYELHETRPDAWALVEMWCSYTGGSRASSPFVWTPEMAARAEEEIAGLADRLPDHIRYPAWAKKLVA